MAVKRQKAPHLTVLAATKTRLLPWSRLIAEALVVGTRIALKSREGGANGFAMRPHVSRGLIAPWWHPERFARFRLVLLIPARRLNQPAGDEQTVVKRDTIKATVA